MRKSSVFQLDLGLFTPVIILVIMSQITLFSINFSFFKTQFIYLIISIFAFFFFSNLNLKILKHYYFIFYLVSILLLVFVLILGSQARGAVRWLDIMGLKIQFSEIIKPFLLISLAHFLALRQMSLKTFFLGFCFLLPIIFLLNKQPDLGNSIIFFSTAVLIFIISGFPFLWFIFGLSLILGSMPIFWHFLYSYQKERLISFFYPSHDPLGISYNAIQSMIAIGSGSLIGKGFNQGTQSYLRFLPERQTDFIFATISENLGFVGSLIILLCFLGLLYRIYVLFLNTNGRFYKIFLGSAFSLILIQVFLNIGMNIGLLPIVGVTLPFVSSGGSSLLANFILIGLINAINKDLKREEILEIK